MPSGSQLVSTIGDDRNAELLGLGDGDLLLVGVDHEQQVGQPAHLLDAAQRRVERVAVARELQAAPSWCSPLASPASISSSCCRRRIDCEIVFQLVSVPPSQRWLM